MSGFAWSAAFALTRATLFQALREANGRAGEVEFGAQLVFEEALIAEMQRLELIGEKHESRRRGSGLRDVEDFHLAAGGRGAFVEVHAGEPTIQFPRGDAFVARFRNAVN
jgi:hypothetical protein